MLWSRHGDGGLFMRFGILGPLSVTEGGRTFELTSSKSRAVLAVLLRHANTPVSDDLLADALWGDRPPRSAAANLRMYVHTLRRTLESADRIARVPPGYALTVRPGSSTPSASRIWSGRAGRPVNGRTRSPRTPR